MVSPAQPAATQTACCRMLHPMAGRARDRATNRHLQRQTSAQADGLPSSERVFRQLRSMIIDGEVGPGTRLVELSLATQFGVSRTPVREALKRLVRSEERRVGEEGRSRW